VRIGPVKGHVRTHARYKPAAEKKAEAEAEAKTKAADEAGETKTEAKAADEAGETKTEAKAADEAGETKTASSKKKKRTTIFATPEEEARVFRETRDTLRRIGVWIPGHLVVPSPFVQQLFAHMKPVQQIVTEEEQQLLTHKRARIDPISASAGTTEEGEGEDAAKDENAWRTDVHALRLIAVSGKGCMVNSHRTARWLLTMWAGLDDPAELIARFKAAPRERVLPKGVSYTTLLSEKLDTQDALAAAWKVVFARSPAVPSLVSRTPYLNPQWCALVPIVGHKTLTDIDVAPNVILAHITSVPADAVNLGILPQQTWLRRGQAPPPRLSANGLRVAGISRQLVCGHKITLQLMKCAWALAHLEGVAKCVGHIKYPRLAVESTIGRELTKHLISGNFLTVVSGSTSTLPTLSTTALAATTSAGPMLTPLSSGETRMTVMPQTDTSLLISTRSFAHAAHTADPWFAKSLYAPAARQRLVLGPTTLAVALYMHTLSASTTMTVRPQTLVIVIGSTHETECIKTALRAFTQSQISIATLRPHRCMMPLALTTTINTKVSRAAWASATHILIVNAERSPVLGGIMGFVQASTTREVAVFANPNTPLSEVPSLARVQRMLQVLPYMPPRISAQQLPSNMSLVSWTSLLPNDVMTARQLFIDTVQICAPPEIATVAFGTEKEDLSHVVVSGSETPNFVGLGPLRPAITEEWTFAPIGNTNADRAAAFGMLLRAYPVTGMTDTGVLWVTRSPATAMQLASRMLPSAATARPRDLTEVLPAINTRACVMQAATSGGDKTTSTSFVAFWSAPEYATREIAPVAGSTSTYEVSFIGGPTTRESIARFPRSATQQASVMVLHQALHPTVLYTMRRCITQLVVWAPDSETWLPSDYTGIFQLWQNLSFRAGRPQIVWASPQESTLAAITTHANLFRAVE
jgi:hypothetical protein